MRYMFLPRILLFLAIFGGVSPKLTTAESGIMGPTLEVIYGNNAEKGSPLAIKYESFIRKFIDLLLMGDCTGLTGHFSGTAYFKYGKGYDLKFAMIRASLKNKQGLPYEMLFGNDQKGNYLRNDYIVDSLQKAFVNRLKGRLFIVKDVSTLEFETNSVKYAVQFECLPEKPCVVSDIMAMKQ